MELEMDVLSLGYSGQIVCSAGKIVSSTDEFENFPII